MRKLVALNRKSAVYLAVLALCLAMLFWMFLPHAFSGRAKLTSSEQENKRRRKRRVSCHSADLAFVASSGYSGLFFEASNLRTKRVRR